MTDFLESYKNHSVHTTLENLGRVLASVPEIEDPAITIRLTRHGDVLRSAKALLDCADATFVSIGNMNQIDKSFSLISNELTKFFSNRSPGHLNNADAHIESLLPHLGPLWISQVPHMGLDLNEDLDNYRLRLQEFRDEMSHTREQYKEEVDSEVEVAKEKLGTLATALAEQKKVLQNQNVRIDSVVETFQSQFSADQQKRNSEYTEGQKGRNVEYHEFLKNTENEWSELQGNIDAAKAEFIEELEKVVDDATAYLENKKTEAANLLKVTANISVTGNYNKMANSDRRWGHFWRFTATILMVVSIFLAFKAVEVALESENGYDMQAVLLRVGIALVVGGPAIYSAREAEKHRRSARQYRRMELELASIDPYLESLKPEDRDELKAKLADRLFAQSDSLGSGKDESVGFLEDLVRTGWNTLLRKTN